MANDPCSCVCYLSCFWNHFWVIKQKNQLELVISFINILVYFKFLFKLYTYVWHIQYSLLSLCIVFSLSLPLIL